MKKIITKFKHIALSSLTLMTVGTLSAQTNLNFENWTGNEPNGWVSSNAITTSNGGAQTVFKLTTAPGQGTASVKMVTGSCPDCPNFSIFGPFGPTTPLPNPLGGSIESGAIPYNQRPISIDFKYKSKPMGNDAGGFDVLLTRYNAASGETETIGEAYFEAGVQVNNWTNMNLPIQYSSGLLPDTLKFFATSSIGSIPDLSALGMPPIFQVPTPVANSEFYIDAININLPSCAGFTASATGTNETGFGTMDGTATAHTNGGTAPYTYTWSNGATTQAITGLLPGLYSVTVVDANGCAKVANYNVLQGSCGAFSVTVTGTEASSFTATDGTATATVTGGVGPYTYLWNTGETTASISGLRLGAYVVTVTDASGNCIAWGYFPSLNGVNDLPLDNDISLYPNPSNGVFSLKSEIKISKVEIMNAIGETIYQSEIENPKLAIDLTAQPNGIYFIHLSNENGSAIKKLVINK